MWLVLALCGMAHGQNLTAKDYFLMASAKYKCRACEQAIEDFNKAIELNANYAEAFYGRSLAYSCVKNYPSALQDIERAIRLKPTEVLYLECKARVKLESGKTQEAKTTFMAAIRLDSTCWQAWYGLGMSERNVDSVRAARRAFERTIRLNPDFAMAYLGRAEMLIKQARYDTALVALSTAGTLAPEYAKVYQLSSIAHLRLNNLEQSVDDASRAIRLDPSDGMSFFWRGEAYFARKDYLNADFDYAEAIKRDKANARAWYMRAKCSEHLGDLPSAKKHLGKSIKRNRKDPTAYTDRAKVWVKLEKPKKALNDLNTAINMRPQDVSLRIQRGYVRLQLDMAQLASDDFVAATRIAPTNGDGFHGLGVARYKLGNLQGACESWKKGAALGDGNCSEELANYCND